MKEHISLEDKEFYPLLSKKLDLKAQEAVISKAKTYILGTIEL